MQAYVKNKNIITTVLIDLLALIFIYFVPAVSHLLNFPLYYADPMRIALFSVLIFTKKENVYLMALTIPIFSFLMSGHPVFPKFILVSLELFINIFLIFRLFRIINNKYLLVFVTLLFSKSIYYLLKYLLIKIALLDSELVSTPLYIQAIVMAVFSLILAITLKNDRIKG